MAEVHGDPSIGGQGPQLRTYEVMAFFNEVARYCVPLHRLHGLIYTHALLFPVKGTETFEAAANSFCLLLRIWPKAVLHKRSLASDHAVPFGKDSGLEEYLNQLALVGNDENDLIDVDRFPRMSELPNPFRVPMFPT